MARGWSKTISVSRACFNTARLFFLREPIGIMALVVSAVGVYTQIAATSVQSAFIKSQGENMEVELDRDRIFEPQAVKLGPFNTTISTWNVTVSNTSIQTSTTITHFAISKRSNNHYIKLMDDGSSSPSYTIFSSRETGKPVHLPFTIAAGATLELSMSLDLQITKEAADRFRQLSESTYGMIDISAAERIYSSETLKKGAVKDMFGNTGFDDGGFSLNAYQRDRDKIDYPVFRLDFISNRGKAYSAYSGWYYMMVVFPDPKDQTKPSENVNLPKAAVPTKNFAGDR